MMSIYRKLPNILITGTPGTGKSTLCSEISEISGFEWLNVGEIAKADHMYDGHNDITQCPVIDEEQMINELEDKIADGGKIIDYHGCDFFPQHWFDIVFILRTNSTTLYNRLVARGYRGQKLENNIQCEFFQTLIDEARGSYNNKIVYELPSNTPDDMEDNVEKICQWINQWKMQNGHG
ncbi:adenylate kinase isoenzyme 6-like [Limulus polyphemus]|uniref:Adenylate kinase isoenzyme 6 homolog n=1 Tax=Limulus polyphemus TaxID=6850 RepID=A0ABM1B2A3_LIMPO|nr:adenylate kinase isoenzyme 6-like [Limulus polyphemus]